MIRFLDKNGAVGVFIMVTLVVIVVAVSADLGHEVGAYPRVAVARQPGSNVREPMRWLDAMFSLDTLGQLAPLTNRITPFHTTYFQPPPAKPVTTRKVELTYRGFYETAQGQKRAFVRVDDQVLVASVGAKLLGDLVVTDIALRTLVLTNGQAQSNRLEFNAGKLMEIPVP
jgi:hypothetical protein